MANGTISTILKYALQVNASDIHITESKALVLRIHGSLVTKTEAGIMSQEKIMQILLELLYGDEEKMNLFRASKDIDFGYLHSDGTSFRINAYQQLGKISLVLRIIASEVVEMQKLGLPESVHKLTKLKQGLVLITGPTGSGKSTTMVSFLDQINKTRDEHIITLEDPVEYIFTDNKSIFSQRNIGSDTKNFPSALRAAMREDPDVIMVGEMRDTETVKAAIELAETGHLVISTLHTSSAVSTITRLLSFFPPDMQNSMRYKLSGVLQGVVSQRLIKRSDENGRIAIFEVMLMNTAIKNMIRQGDLINIQSTIETGMKHGMVAMKDYADKLEAKGIINENDYIDYFYEEE